MLPPELRAKPVYMTGGYGKTKVSMHQQRSSVLLECVTGLGRTKGLDLFQGNHGRCEQPPPDTNVSGGGAVSGMVGAKPTCFSTLTFDPDRMQVARCLMLPAHTLRYGASVPTVVTAQDREDSWTWVAGPSAALLGCQLCGDSLIQAPVTACLRLTLLRNAW